MEREITSQYKASLRMLTDVIKKCPDSLWDNAEYENQYWRIVYHALFYTHLYLFESPEKFIPWIKHVETYNYLGTVTSENKPVVIDCIYNKDEMIDYARLIYNDCENLVRDNNAKESGFDWLPMSRLEIHFYNLRHLQHHTGQLIERLHQAGIKGIKWEGRG